jgi:hypothetical protein
MEKATAKLEAFSAEARNTGIAAGASFVALALAMKKAIDGASNLAENANLLNVAFGKNAAGIDEWAKVTSRAMQRGSGQMLKMAASAQAFLAPMLGDRDKATQFSKDMAQLAVDLSSFFNVDDEEAFSNLKSALSGESEPVKKFGIVMTDTALNAYLAGKKIKTTMAQLDEASKTQVRWQFILDRTRDAQGDAARTADGYANVMRGMKGRVADLAAKFGNALLPAATKIADALSRGLDILSRWMDNDTFAKITAGAAAAALAVTGLTAGVIGLAAVMPSLTNGFSLLSKYMPALAAGGDKVIASFAKFGPMGLAIIAVVGALVMLAGTLYQAWKICGEDIKQAFGDAFEWISNSVVGPAVEWWAAALDGYIDHLARALQQLDKRLSGMLSDTVARYGRGVSRLGTLTGSSTLSTLGEQIQEASEKFKDPTIFERWSTGAQKMGRIVVGVFKAAKAYTAGMTEFAGYGLKETWDAIKYGFGQSMAGVKNMLADMGIDTSALFGGAADKKPPEYHDPGLKGLTGNGNDKGAAKIEKLKDAYEKLDLKLDSETLDTLAVSFDPATQSVAAYERQLKALKRTQEVAQVGEEIGNLRREIEGIGKGFTKEQLDKAGVDLGQLYTKLRALGDAKLAELKTGFAAEDAESVQEMKKAFTDLAGTLNNDTARAIGETFSEATGGVQGLETRLRQLAYSEGMVKVNADIAAMRTNLAQLTDKYGTEALTAAGIDPSKLAAQIDALEKAQKEKLGGDFARATTDAFKEQTDEFLNVGLQIGNAIVDGIRTAMNSKDTLAIFQSIVSVVGMIVGAAAGNMQAGAGIAGLFNNMIGLTGSRHSGGYLPYAHRGMAIAGAPMAGEIDIRALRGEGILRRNAVSLMGGESGVNALNRLGEMNLGGISISMPINASGSALASEDATIRTMRKVLPRMAQEAADLVMKQLRSQIPNLGR